jgi:hypothetical protein
MRTAYHLRPVGASSERWREARPRRAAICAAGGPLVVLVDGAEFLRDDELGAVLSAAEQTKRVVILRILEGV